MGHYSGSKERWKINPVLLYGKGFDGPPVEVVEAWQFDLLKLALKKIAACSDEENAIGLASHVARQALQSIKDAAPQ